VSALKTQNYSLIAVFHMILIMKVFDNDHLKNLYFSGFWIIVISLVSSSS